MVIVKPKSTFEGQNNPPEGRQIFVFNGVVEPTQNGSYRFEADYLNDPSARKVSVFGGSNNQSSLENLMGIIYNSGVGVKMKKKKPTLPDPADGWDDSILKNPSLIEQIKVDIIGCKIGFDIVHVGSKWKDKDGNEREGVNPRCKEMFLVNSTVGAKEGAAAEVSFD
jgi:hypothetical protein